MSQTLDPVVRTFLSISSSNVSFPSTAISSTHCLRSLATWPGRPRGPQRRTLLRRKKKLLRLRQTELFPSAQSLRTRKSVGRCKRCAKCAEFVDAVHILHVSQSFVQNKILTLKKDDCKCRSVSCPRLVESTNGLALADFDGSDGWLVEEKNRRQRRNKL